MAEAPVTGVYVPSVIEEERGPIGLGCFSEEATAWRVLRAFLRKTVANGVVRILCRAGFGKWSWP